MSEAPRVKLQCNDCHGQRWHVLRASYAAEGEEEVDGETEYWTDKFEIFQCQGCESVLVRRSFDFSLFIGQEPEQSYFPARISRRRPQWLQQVSGELQSLLGEVYNALHADSPRLALMGIRAVVDLAIMETVGDVGSFPEKLAALEKGGFVGQKQREFLAAVLAAGNAAAHRGHAASTQELEFAMDIVENLLQAIYALEGAAQHIRVKTPPRRNSTKSGD